MFLDIVVIILIALFAFTGFKRGMIYSVVGILGSLIAVTAASFISSAFSPDIYNDLFMGKITDAVASAFSGVPPEATIEQQTHYLFNSMPSLLVNGLSCIGITENGLTEQIVSSSASVPEVIESLVRPIIIKLITIVFTSLLFVIFTVIIKIIANTLTKSIDATKLSIVNKVGGALVGVAEAIVLIMIFSLILYFVMMFLSSDSFNAVQNTIDNSLLYKVIYRLSLPDAIISFMVPK